MALALVPFEKANELDSGSAQSSLPGYPNISTKDPNTLVNFLHHDIRATELDRLTKHIRLRSNSADNISLLHHHRFKAREIFISEDPELHLTFIYDRLFLKPIPKYLLSHAFWELYLVSNNSALGPHQPSVLAAAKGFLRSYYYLIQYESDLSIAHDSGLLASTVSWDKWCAFINGFQHVSDNEVSPRYHHGQLSIPKLNWLSKLYLHRFRFKEMHGPSGGYLKRFYEPLLFLFGVSSLVLSAMQVTLGALPDITAHSTWVSFVQCCRWIGIINLSIMLLLLVVIPAQWILVLLGKGVAVIVELFSA